MKISQREKTLLLVLLIAALCYLGYTFGYSAYVNYKDGLQTEYNSLNTQYDAVSTAIQMKPVYERDLTATKESIQKLSYGYMDKIEQEKILVYLKDAFEKNNVIVDAYSFSPVKIEAEAPGNAVVQKIEYTMTYKASFSNLKAVISELQDGDINAVISSINTTVGNEKELSGSMNVAMFSVDNDYTKANAITWEDLFDSGNTDPFLYEGTVVNTEAASRKYDFLMTAKPIYSDLPTVIMQAASDEEGITNISIDNNAVESVRMYLKAENGQYMYRYETANSSYPLNNEWAVIEPANNGYINVKIMSTARTTAEDASGLKLTIDNQAGIGVNVYVIGDDTERPRVSVDNMAGVRVYNE